VHWPVEQPSAVNAEHATQAAPLVPHVPREGVSQLAPAQQPDAQFCAVHEVQTPPWQLAPEHDEHWEPPLPQLLGSVVPARQLFPEQQPLHDVPSHTQAPWTQRWPATQAEPVPHWHWPSLAQLSAVAPHVWQVPPAKPQLVSVCVSHTAPLQQPSGHELALHRQVPPTHTWPCAHWLPVLPQVQLPLLHVSARVRLQP
jgi:hypothetical protein